MEKRITEIDWPKAVADVKPFVERIADLDMLTKEEIVRLLRRRLEILLSPSALRIVEDNPKRIPSEGWAEMIRVFDSQGWRPRRTRTIFDRLIFTGRESLSSFSRCGRVFPPAGSSGADFRGC